MARHLLPGLARHSAALCAYLLLALALTWPLPTHLSSHLTGPAGGDASVYVWNLWVFHHELAQGHAPFHTTAIFPLTGGCDLALHNYTVFADLLALPLLGHLEVVSVFNLIYLFLIVLNGYAVFLLARRLTAQPAVAWLAGAVFAASPVMTARSVGHFSLVAAAPLALFLLFTLRFLDHRRWPDAALAGAMLAWSAYCDAYFPVFCVLLGAVTLVPRVATLRTRSVPLAPRLARLAHALDAVVIALAVLLAAAALGGITSLNLLGVRVGLRTYYTPAMVATLLALARLLLTARPRLHLQPRAAWVPPLRFVLIAGACAAALLAPLLLTLARQAATGNFVSPKIFWRSSPRGVDLLAFLLPNPFHPLAPISFQEWLTVRRGDDLPEMTASVSLVALAVILWAARTGALPRFWTGLTATFAALALGPFVQLGGFNTCVPGPWAVLRYLPVIGLARSPSRFAIVATLGFTVLFAYGLTLLCERHRRARPALLLVLGGALAAELIPAPRMLYSAAISPVFTRIAADPDPHLRVLELPTGVRDGTSSIGDFNARAQLNQTRHQKAILGGYISRVSEQRQTAYRRMPVMNALLALAERRALTAEETAQASGACQRFASEARLGYVLFDQERMSPALRAFAMETLGLQHLETAGGYELYKPVCAPPSASARDPSRHDGQMHQASAP